MTTSTLAPVLRGKLVLRPEGSWCVYADGGITQKRGVIGMGVVLEDPYGNIVAELAVPCKIGGTPPFVKQHGLPSIPRGHPSTSQHAELLAMLAAVDVLRMVALNDKPERWRFHVVSDSAYALGIATGAYKLGGANDWLCRTLKNAVDSLRKHARVTFGHVRGHRDCAGNVRADILAGVAKHTNAVHAWCAKPRLWSLATLPGGAPKVSRLELVEAAVNMATLAQDWDAALRRVQGSTSIAKVTLVLRDYFPLDNNRERLTHCVSVKVRGDYCREVFLNPHPHHFGGLRAHAHPYGVDPVIKHATRYELSVPAAPVPRSGSMVPPSLTSKDMGITDLAELLPVGGLGEACDIVELYVAWPAKPELLPDVYLKSGSVTGRDVYGNALCSDTVKGVVLLLRALTQAAFDGCEDAGYIFAALDASDHTLTR